MRGSGRGRGGRGGRGGSRGGRGLQQPRQSSTTPFQKSDDGTEGAAVAPPLPPTIVTFEKRTPAQLRYLKLRLLNTVSASLIKEPRFEAANSIANTITTLVKEIAFYDPEFVLKLALYCRDDLGIRSTSNYLVSLASNLKSCHPYIRRYFSATIKLPSDWLDVAATYQMLPDKTLRGSALPTSLRKAMVEKFPSFDAYQLGKYNKEGSIMRKKRKIKLLMKKDPEKAKELMAAAAAAKPTLTIKRMIRLLHLSAPPSNVMCILGKKYPATREDFVKSGLPGEFESQRAGKRMKLPVPETWETLLSAKGNKAATWEELIEHKKLPFMAMLRNIRNLIFAGVAPRYHRWVINKLTNEETIAQSRQFPFQFFSAYEVIPSDLDDFNVKLAEMNQDRGAKGKGAAGAKKAPKKGPNTFVKKKKLIIPLHMPESDLFDRYRAALDTSVKLATTRNVKPIRGTTVVFCDVSPAMREPCKTARGMGKFSQSDELGILLGLMCKYVCEDCTFRVFRVADGACEHHPVELDESSILDNMASVKEFANNLPAAADSSASDDVKALFPFSYMEDLIKSRTKIDNLLVVSHKLVATAPSAEDDAHQTVHNILKKYRQEVNPDVLFVSVDLSGRGNSVSQGGDQQTHPNDVMITGFSDSILRFIAERGDTNQLQYVEHIDEAKRIPKEVHANEAASSPPYLEELDLLAAAGKVTESSRASVVPRAISAAAAHEKWRTARVFISSTFLDMHGERDLLTRHVFPELRERCRARRIRLVEVDLRWGITEEDAQYARQLELCLSEIDRCRPFFIGLFGRRYGYVPKDYRIASTDPKFEWLRTFPPGRSVTELEMQYAALRDPTKASRAFFYLRDHSFVSGVPQEHRRVFESESKEAATRVEALRQAILASPCKRVDGYTARWGGVDASGRPILTALDELRAQVINDLWTAICEEFPAEPPVFVHPLDQERSEHQAFAQNHTRHFVGRKDTLDLLTRFCDGASALSTTLADNGTGIVVVSGPSGSGKSALLAQFSQQYAALSTRKKAGSAAPPSLFLLSHHIGASAGSTDVRKMLFRICSELARRFALDTPAVTEDYNELRKIFPEILQQAAFQGRVVLVIDGLNQLDPANRALSLEWLPTKSPVKIVLSTVDTDATFATLRRRKPAPRDLILAPLDIKDRQQLVRLTLAEYHKKLDERPMNEQMRVLLKKADATNPLYLILACEELRMFGVFEQLSERIKNLSTLLPRLMEEILHRLEVDHGRTLVSTALGCIACARGGLLESELRALLRRQNEDELPQSVWTPFLRAIQHFLRPIPRDEDGDAPISFFYFQMHLAITHRYLDADSGVRAHKTLAEFFLRKGRDYRRTLSELPFHLSRARMWAELEATLTDLAFVEKKCALGMSHDLTADYLEACSPANRIIWGTSAHSHTSSFSSSAQVAVAAGLQRVIDFWQFVSASSHVLARRPHLVFQQAANQPSASAPSRAALSLWGSKGEKRAWIKWLNKPEQHDACKMTLNTFADAVTASAISRDGSRIACASRDCSVRVFDAATGSELAVFVGHTNWVVSCVFSPNGQMLASASWDNTVKLWDVSLGSEVYTLQGHTRAVNACQFSPDGKELVSAAWDSSLRVWDTTLGRCLRVLRGHTKPVNIVVYSPDGKTIASAGWDGTVRVWPSAAAQQQRRRDDDEEDYRKKEKDPHVVLAGHAGSVRGLAFAPSGKQLVSSGVDRQVLLWDVGAKKLISALGSHPRPTTSCAYNAEGKMLASASDDGTVKVWAAMLGKEITSTHVSSGWLNCVAFSPDDKRIAAGSSECTVRIFEYASWTQIHSLSGHTRTVSCIAFSPVDNGRLLASGSDDGTARLWDTITGRLLVLLTGHRDCVGCVAFSPLGTRLATASDDFTVRLWNIEELDYDYDAAATSAVSVQEIGGHSNIVRSVAFSPDGKYLASASRDCTIRLYKAESGQFITQLLGHLDWINCVAFAPDSRHLVSSAWDYNLKVWDVKKGTEISTLKGHALSVEACGFSQDGQTVVSCSYDTTVRVWDPTAGTEITQLSGHTQRINGMGLAHDNRTAASVSDDGTLRVWDYLSGSEITTLVGHADAVTSCSFSPVAPNTLISTSNDSTAKVWDVSATTVDTSHAAWVNACCFSRDGAFLASVAADQTLKVWNTKTAKCERTVTIPAVRGCAYLPDGRVVTASNDGSLLLWDDALRNSTELSGHSNAVRACACAANGRYIVSASWDCTVRVWSPSGHNVHTLTGHTDWVDVCAIDANGKFAASGARDNTVRLWQLGSSSSSVPVVVLRGHENWVSALAFSDDGRFLASGSYDNAVRVWDVASQRCVNVLRGHKEPVSGLAFTPKGGRLFSVSLDGVLHLWDLETGAIVSEFVHAGPATAFAFSSAARMLACGDSIGNVYLLQYVRKQQQ